MCADCRGPTREDGRPGCAQGQSSFFGKLILTKLTQPSKCSDLTVIVHEILDFYLECHSMNCWFKTALFFWTYDCFEGGSFVDEKASGPVLRSYQRELMEWLQEKRLLYHPLKNYQKCKGGCTKRNEV